MKKKIVGLVIILLVISAFIANHLITYARVAEQPIYVGLTATNLQNVGYGIGNPNPPVGGTSNKGEYIWNIRTYKSNSTDSSAISDVQRNLYCVKADYGQTWFTEENAQEILGYELYYDIQSSDRNTLLNNLQNDTNNIIADLLNPNGNQYKQLLWLFDNSYIPGVTVLDDYLAQFGILKDLDENMYYQQETDEWYGEESLTEADIIAIQRMAIWYFTNGGDFDKTNETLWLNITTDGTNYNSLAEVSTSRNKMAMDLYKSLIARAKTGASQYTENNNYKLDSAPATVDVTDLNNIEVNNKTIYVTETTRKDSNYLIGPIVIDKNNDLGYNISIIVADQGGNTLTQNTDYVFTDVTGTPIQMTSLKDLVGIEEGFYVSVPRSKIESVNIKVSISYKTTPKKLWLDGTEAEDGKITLNSEQPLIEVTQDPKTLDVEIISQPEEFDLALRKYITSVSSENGQLKTIENPRNLNNISVRPQLQTGTTADYLHRKDPVVVEKNDIVTYTIRIYNEGDKAGFASKIIDQLPEGLIRDNSITTVVSKDKNGNTKNTYTLEQSTSLTTTNQVVLKIVDTAENPAQSLQPYTMSGGLDYETIEIKCKVIQEADTKNQIILTNVAWIAEAYEYDEEQQKHIISDNDRDSSPTQEHSPNVNKTNMSDYRGTTEAGKELSDNEYFYKGQQDDDDFEKLVIMPVPKKFDLALVKFITAISDDETIEESEYLVEEDGTYSRAPEVKFDANTGKLSYDFTNRGAKNPLIVEPGDYVLYTIRVYNEGELDGYASKIEDRLPKGLQFVNGEFNAEYRWALDIDYGDGRQTIATEWFAKGNGADEVTPGSNLLKAFNKEVAISEQNPDYIDAQVLCQVMEEPTSNRVLTNYAEIAQDSDENGDPIDDIDSTPDNEDKDEDDIDYEKVKVQYFDLSLRKFITSVNNTELKNNEGKYERAPIVNVTPLKDGTASTAIYTHPKQPVAVQVGDKVVYTIRVYNEGDIKGFASEVKDYLPPYLTYVRDSEINAQYKWTLSENGRIVTTTYLANTELEAFNGTELDYADLKIECIVSDNAPVKQNQTNIAEISKYKYNGNEVDTDIDSTADNMVSNKWLPSDENLPTYMDQKINETYVPGNEDDDDFEKIYVQEFDLALRKFITKVQDKEITTRVPQVDITPLKNGEGTAKYEHPKDALTVHVGDVVIYTLRIYNEGEISGYASEITDDIPEYLEYLPEDSTNVEYMWKMYDENGKETENVVEAVSVKTTYLSKENKEENLIKAFDGETLSYKDIKIAFKVKDPNSNTYIITNHAQISNDTDEAGNSVKDKDSEPAKWNEGEDDQDIENVKVEYFDLSLLKFVSKVIVTENGKETITETGYNGHEDPEPVVKVELHKKKLDKVVVKFGYGITITNESDIPGYATEITDYVPEGLKFDPTDNPEWMDEGNNVISTRQLEDVLLQPGESKTIEVILTWINGKDNLALKTNTAEISEDKNEYNVPDRDSTPDNKQDGEDDIDIAKVILAVSTGAMKTYFMLTLGLLLVVATGVILIKRFVI